MDQITTIQIRLETRDLLKHTGRKDQTYDDLINELIKIKGKGKQETEI
jgi:hypothetical protein